MNEKLKELLVMLETGLANQVPEEFAQANMEERRAMLNEMVSSLPASLAESANAGKIDDLTDFVTTFDVDGKYYQVYVLELTEQYGIGFHLLVNPSGTIAGMLKTSDGKCSYRPLMDDMLLVTYATLLEDGASLGRLEGFPEDGGRIKSDPDTLKVLNFDAPINAVFM
jgi:hypothetical protein